MKKLFCFFIMLMALLSLHVKASPIDNIQTYYQNKDKTLASAIIQDISDKDILKHNKTAYAGIYGFLIGLLIENPQYYQLFKTKNLSNEVKNTLENVKKSIDYTKGNIEMYADYRQIWDPSNLDSLWGVFFATGNEKIPEAIRVFIEEQHKIMPANEINITVMAAEWSLKSNAKQHPIVKKSYDKLIKKK